ncbi:unnamed protein product [Urochloa humidicola]
MCARTRRKLSSDALASTDEGTMHIRKDGDSDNWTPLTEQVEYIGELAQGGTCIYISTVELYFNPGRLYLVLIVKEAMKYGGDNDLMCRT